MTYLGFHLRFNLPVLLLLGWAAGPSFFAGGSLFAAVWVLAAVFLFTIPWDNHAAACGIWGFPREKYSLRIAYLPVEEYAFFAIQSLQAMLLMRWLCDRFPGLNTVEIAPGRVLTGLLLFALLATWLAVGARFRPHLANRCRYAWHLLYWFSPVILVQWAIGWTVLVPRLGLLLLVTGVLGSWLAFADAVAIRNGVWWVDPGQTTGWQIGKVLPWEEAAFFYLTSLLVAQSYLLWLPEPLR